MGRLRILDSLERQMLVNTHFESHVTQWMEVYEQATGRGCDLSKAFGDSVEVGQQAFAFGRGKRS
jgi:hypothetical protein